MNRAAWILHAVLAATFLSAIGATASAAPPDLLRDYIFLPAKTSVHVTGGSPPYNMYLTIAGKFGLVTGYDEVVSPTASTASLVPHAEFIDVHGILYNPLSLAPRPVPGWDLDKTLDLSSLKGTFTAGNPNRLFFFGADGAGVALRLEADISGRFLHLTGGSSDPPGANAVLYQIDALARQLPFPDFNGDGSITAADIPAMLAALADPNAFQARHSMSNDDLLNLGDFDGDGQITNADIQGTLDFIADQDGSVTTAVPEPTTLILAGCNVVGALLLCRNQIGGGQSKRSSAANELSRAQSIRIAR